MTTIADLYAKSLDGPRFRGKLLPEISILTAGGISASIMVPRYHIDLFWWPEDQCWIANVPDLKYCSAHGDTPEDAAREIAVAMALWLESAAAHSDPIPDAVYRSEVSTFGRAA